MNEIMAMLVKEFMFYGIDAKKEQIKLWAKELEDLEINDIQASLENLRKDSNRTRPPMPAQIREEVSGWPKPEQAWSEAPKSEENSAVMTTEAAIALDHASPFLRDGNMIQARMVFIEVYKNEVAKSLAAKTKAKWFPSLGAYSTTEEKDRAIMEAVHKNRISPQIALSYRDNLKIELPKQSLKLIESKYEAMTDDVRERNLERTQQLLKQLNQKNEAKTQAGSES